LVLVRMVGLRQLAIGGLQILFARRPSHTEYRVRVAHILTESGVVAWLHFPILYGDGPPACPDLPGKPRFPGDFGGWSGMSTLTERLYDDADRAPIDPFAVFEEWFAEAREKEPNDPHAMAVATIGTDGMPDVRMVLMNARDARGFVFFTNFDSTKGQQLQA